MPVEAPASPPSSQKDLPIRGSRYEGREAHELVQLLDDMDDERARARRREAVYISVIFYMLVWWFVFYGPQVLWHAPRLISPADALKQKNLTYLDLPPDALKKLRPKQPQAIADKDHVAQSKHPTLDKKTLAQIQAMQPSAPPAPTPEQQSPPVPQVQNLPPTPQPQPTVQKPLLEAPVPQARPDFTHSTSAADSIQEAVRNASKGGYQSGNNGINAPSQHQGLSSNAEVLSDTLGVDFGPYLNRILYDIKRNWIPLMPEEVYPPLRKQGVVTIRFRILPDGSIDPSPGGIMLEGPSGDVALDKAAWGAIVGEGKFPPLPKEFTAQHGQNLDLRISFLYNKDLR